jgi:hypothetical protein
MNMEFYKNNPTNLHNPTQKRKLGKKQRKQEIINNLTNTINSESAKIVGGNKDLIQKLQFKLDDAIYGKLK